MVTADKNYLDLFLVQSLELFSYVGSCWVAGQYSVVEVASYQEEVWPVVKRKIDQDFEQDLGRLHSCHAFVHTTRRGSHCTSDRRSSRTRVSRNNKQHNRIDHLNRKHCSLHDRPNRLLRSPQIRYPARQYGPRCVQELQSMDSTTRILLPNRSNRNTLRRNRRNRSAILRRRSMGLPIDLPTHRTNPHNQSRYQHRPRPRRHRHSEAQPKLALVIRKRARIQSPSPSFFWGSPICSETRGGRGSSGPSSQIE